MRGGGRALPKFFVHFSKTVYIESIWGWGDPCQFFLVHWRSKKALQVVQIRGRGGGGGGGGGQGNLDKIQQNSYFFS